MSKRTNQPLRFGCVIPLVAILGCWPAVSSAAEPETETKTEAKPAETAAQTELRAALKKLPCRIVYESYRGDNWELFLMNADGSNGVNLTRTGDVQELYPHASPDGKRICFVADEGKDPSMVRNVYCMDVDGTGRVLVARNARQPCWSPDGGRIAYLKGEFDRFTYKDFATKELFLYDLKTGKHTQHPNGEMLHLYNLCWTGDGNWFLATVHGGMGFKHANLAFQADGSKVFRLDKVNGCRPDASIDSARITWNASDQLICMAELDLKADPPAVSNVRNAVTCDKKHEVYHSDWSPDGRYICFSYGPSSAEQVGLLAKDWHICVADTQTGTWVVLTSDGMSNKEPDWVPAAGGK